MTRGREGEEKGRREGKNNGKACRQGEKMEQERVAGKKVQREERKTTGGK